MTTSPWLPVGPDFAPLNRNETADTCIIGGGIAGVSAALFLARAGLRVVLLERGSIAGGETGFSTAHIVTAYDDRWHELERLRGLDEASLVAKSYVQAIDKIEENISSLNIKCGFERVPGYLMLSSSDHDTEVLHKEAASAARVGLTEVDLVPEGLNFPATGPCLKFNGQAQFNPREYVGALTVEVARLGGLVHTDTPVTEYHGGSSPLVRTAAGFEISCGSIVLATNSPVGRIPSVQTKLAPYRTYAIAARIPAGSFPAILLWDTGFPYHYIRLFPKGSSDGSDLLIVGGEDHKTGQANDGKERLSRLEAWARKFIPALGQVEYRWSGQILETIDGLPLIGDVLDAGKNVYLICGDSGTGITHGTIGAMVTSDLILGRKNEYAELYRPGRTPLHAAPEFARENANVALQYSDWLTPGEVSSESEIARGEGAIIRKGLQKEAVYRDETGEVRRLSATCPHLGCIIHWNSLEKSWDCPCHGSRYAADGSALNGPTLSGLRPLEREDQTDREQQHQAADSTISPSTS